jgi:hypothetical protein
MGPGFVAKPRPPRPPSKRTQAQRFAEIRAKSSIRCAEALKLRESGLTFKAIGERYGISGTMASYLVRRGTREVGEDVSETGWLRRAEEARTDREREQAERRVAEAAAEAAFRNSRKRARDRLKRAWGRWQVEMYQQRLARTAEPGGDDMVLAHALQQLWRQFIEPRRPPVAQPPPWLQWTDTAGITYRDVPGRLEPEWRAGIT